MTTRHDDQARLTAYALGEELSADEQREIEALLEEDDNARLEVESLREVAALLRDELGSEAEDIAPLSEAIQQRIEARAADVAGAAGAASTAEAADAAGAVSEAAASEAATRLSPESKAGERSAAKPSWGRRRRLMVASGIAVAATVLLAVGVMFPMLSKQAADSSVAAAGTGVVASSSSSPVPSSRFASGVEREKSGQGQGSGVASNEETNGARANADPAETKEADKPADGDDGVQKTQLETGRLGKRQRLATPRFKLVASAPLSTFSVDVDTAAYANVRRFLSRNMMPPRALVRVEEMINYFAYDYPQPDGAHPLGVHLEVASAPWNTSHRLVRVALAAKSMRAAKRPPSNLVFLIDVSGSMSARNKLPLLRNAMSMLVRQLGEKDRVAIVVYAGASGLVLPSTSCAADTRARVLAALEKLSSGGSTNGGAGIELAYQVAVANFIPGGINRVVLATDGDFNVGVSSRTALVRMIKQKAKTGVYLSVLGFGMSSHSDSTLEQIADKGNGHYAYIDTLAEARKVLVDELSSTLVTVAKDVKIQVEFNPARVVAYRLIGYDNRRLAARDFANDKKDAGEVGAGHRVTALYEVVPVGASSSVPGLPRLKYQRRTVAKDASKEMLTVKVRYKRPSEQQSTLMSKPLVDEGASFTRASTEFRFAAAVAWFGEALRGSPFVERHPYQRILGAARAARGGDRFGYRRGFISLVRHARALTYRSKRRQMLYDAYR
ncbi:MAG: von Willebrand factor type A domain-containing protein [Myxococcales bacterium]|nr:von Willebrand factor type A domain-containing protein [Myxococcales bacterium]